MKKITIESGMYENHAQRPYNRFQRLVLKFIGMALGRQLV